MYEDHEEILRFTREHIETCPTLCKDIIKAPSVYREFIIIGDGTVYFPDLKILFINKGGKPNGSDNLRF